MLILYFDIFCPLVSADCPDPNCSGKGYCVSGQCVCRRGWLPPDCSQVRDTVSADSACAGLAAARLLTGKPVRDTVSADSASAGEAGSLQTAHR